METMKTEGTPELAAHTEPQVWGPQTAPQSKQQQHPCSQAHWFQSMKKRFIKSLVGNQRKTMPYLWKAKIKIIPTFPQKPYK